MSKQTTITIVSVAVLIYVTGCSGSPAPSTGSTSVSASGSASDSPSPIASADPSASVSSGDIVVTCTPPSVGSDVNITTIDSNSGVLTSVSFTFGSEEFKTEYGEVTWNPTDSSEIASGVGDPCQGWEWNRLRTDIMGTVSVTNGNTVPASVSIEDNTLTLLTPVTQSTGFASASQNQILDAVFGPDDSVWWLEQASNSTRTVALHHGGDTQKVTFPSDVDVENGVTITFGRGGAWVLNAMANNDASEPVWATATGISFAQSMPLPAFPTNAISADKLQQLLPQTQYNVQDGIYSTDRAQIAFFAGLQDQSSQLFSVPASGGDPTQVTNESDFSSFGAEMIYFGPHIDDVVMP